jgi:hypothetical protein
MMATADGLRVAARTAGAITADRKLDCGDDARFEPICIDHKRGTIVNRAYQPTTPEAWVADCKQRGVIPVA